MCRSIRSSISRTCLNFSRTTKSWNGIYLIAWQRDVRLTGPTSSPYSTRLSRTSSPRSSRMPKNRETSRKTRSNRWRTLKSLSPGTSNWKRFPSSQVSTLLFLTRVEERGRTIFLLKQKAKPSKGQKKRRMVSLLQVQPAEKMQVDS